MEVFNVIIGKTYYLKGYFNPGKDASLILGDENEQLTFLFNGKTIDINCKINRTSNKNGSVRLYGGKNFVDFIQANYKLKEDLEFTVLSKNEINFIKNG